MPGLHTAALPVSPVPLTGVSIDANHHANDPSSVKAAPPATNATQGQAEQYFRRLGQGQAHRIYQKLQEAGQHLSTALKPVSSAITQAFPRTAPEVIVAFHASLPKSRSELLQAAAHAAIIGVLPPWASVLFSLAAIAGVHNRINSIQEVSEPPVWASPLAVQELLQAPHNKDQAQISAALQAALSSGDEPKTLKDLERVVEEASKALENQAQDTDTAQATRSGDDR